MALESKDVRSFVAAALLIAELRGEDAPQKRLRLFEEPRKAVLQ